MKRYAIVAGIALAALAVGKALEDTAKRRNDPDRAAYEARFKKSTCDLQDLGTLAKSD